MKSKKDFLSYFKPCLIVALILIVVAGVVFGVWGFNKGFDFTGGTQLVVKFAEYNNDEPEGLTDAEREYATMLEQILYSHQVKVNTFQILGSYTNKSFVVTFKKTTDKNLQDIRLEANNRFNKSTEFAQLVENGHENFIFNNDAYTQYDITKDTCVIDGFVADGTLLTTISTLLFALVVCMIYGLFRVKLAGGLSIALSGILSVLLTCAFVLFVRLEINTYFFVCLGLVEVLSVYLTIDTLFGLRAKLKDYTLTDKTNAELANMVANENFVKNLTVGVLALLVAFVVGLFGVLSIFKLMLVAIIGVVVSLAINLFVVPAFWTWASKKRSLSKPIVVPTDSQIANEKDDNAEVIEVE